MKEYSESSQSPVNQEASQKKKVRWARAREVFRKLFEGRNKKTPETEERTSEQKAQSVL